MSAPATPSEHEARTGLPLLRHYHDETGDTNTEDQYNFSYHMLQNQQAPMLNAEQNQSHTIQKNNSLSSELPEHDSDEKPSLCRRAKAAPAIGQAVLDICITLTSVCFLAFAIIIISQDGKSAKSKTAEMILDAARLVSDT